MNFKLLFRRFFLLACILCALVNANGQETTASLSGTVKDSKGELLEGVTIVVKHVPTGYVVQTTTNSKGYYYIANLQAGGPYSITYTFVGQNPEQKDDYSLILGNNPLSIDLKPATQDLTAVVVTGRGAGRSGANTTVGQNQIRTIPSLNRSLQDVTKITPQSNNNSFAGTNFRYNNVTIDGAINNDAIANHSNFVAKTVSLVLEYGNKYTGYAEMIDGSRHPITVTYDGNKLIYQFTG